MSKQTFIIVFAVDDKGKQEEWQIMASSAGQAVVDAMSCFPKQRSSRFSAKKTGSLKLSGFAS